MCDCDKNIDTAPTGVGFHLPCEAVTIDMLRIYKTPIDCYINNGLWGSINSSREELLSAQTVLSGLIERRRANPADCEGIDALALVSNLVNRIMQKGACL